MEKLILLTLFSLLFISNNGNTQQPKDKAPFFLKGTFIDDYKISYTINDTLWIQHPRTKFHIIKWNTEKQYLIARNDAANPGDQGKYTRIDYMPFTGMPPWNWGYCLTAYAAETDAAAEATAAADREHPKQGCNGYPFSRMMVKPLTSEKQ